MASSTDQAVVRSIARAIVHSYTASLHQQEKEDDTQEKESTVRMANNIVQFLVNGMNEDKDPREWSLHLQTLTLHSLQRSKADSNKDTQNMSRANGGSPYRRFPWDRAPK